MKNSVYFEAEPFSTYRESEFEGELFSPDLAGKAWEGEVNRRSREYIRWVQRSLNQIMGLRLAEDGILGLATRSAIRGFQAQAGLVADGKVGPRTEAALLAAGATPLPSSGTRPGPVIEPPIVVRPCPRLPLQFVVDDYNRNQRDIRSAQQRKLDPVVSAMLRSLSRGCTPVQRIVVVGHASTEGSVAYNERLGRQRAEAVRRYLEASLGILSVSISPPVVFDVRSEGERRPTVAERTEADRKRNRRVEIALLPSEDSSCGVPRRAPLAEIALEFDIENFELERSSVTVQPRLCLFQNSANTSHRNHFQCGALRQARRIGAIASPDAGNCRRRVGATSYDTGADIIGAIEAAYHCLGRRAINIVHIFSHGFPPGVPGTTSGSAGLYQNSFSWVERGAGGRTVADVPTGRLTNNVVFVLHGCNMAAGSDNFARSLYEHLARTLSNPKVYGHHNGGCASRNNSWREYSNRHPTGRNIRSMPYYTSVRCC